MDYLHEFSIDILCLSETKLSDGLIPLRVSTSFDDDFKIFESQSSDPTGSYADGRTKVQFK
jgi:exonuclease III